MRRMLGPHAPTFDLNLLLVFLALWKTRSVTKASEKLALTQPAVSHALRRLREALEDELFVQSRNGLLPTARAEQLAGPLQAALHDIGASLASNRAFDPSTSSRSFDVATSELVELSIAPALFAAVHREAPQVLVRLSRVPEAPVAHAMLESGDVSVVIGSRAIRGAGLRQRAFADVRMSVLASRSLGVRQREFPLELYLSLPHVVIRPPDHRGSKVDHALAERGVKRKIGAVVQNYAVMAMVAARCGFVCNVPSEVAEQFAPALDMTVHQLPVELSRTPTILSWHRRHEADPGFAWLLGTVQQVLAASEAAQPVASPASSKRSLRAR